MVSVHLPVSLATALRDRAAREGESVSVVARQALRAGLATGRTNTEAAS